MSCPYLYNVLYNNVQEIFIIIETSQGPTRSVAFGVLIIPHLLLQFFFLYFIFFREGIVGGDGGVV